MSWSAGWPSRWARSSTAPTSRSSSAPRRTATARPLLEELAALRAEHATRLALFEELETRDYPDPSRLAGAELDQYLVLRGGIRMEQFWVDWLDEYLSAHEEKERTS